MQRPWADPDVQIEVAVLFGKPIRSRLFHCSDAWAEVLKKIEKGTEGPGVTAANVALLVH
jgi:hypothetical protein